MTDPDVPDGGDMSMADLAAHLEAGGFAEFRCSECGWPSGLVAGIDEFKAVCREHKCKRADKRDHRLRRLLFGATTRDL